VISIRLKGIEKIIFRYEVEPESLLLSNSQQNPKNVSINSSRNENEVLLEQLSILQQENSVLENKYSQTFNKYNEVRSEFTALQKEVRHLQSDNAVKDKENNQMKITLKEMESHSTAISARNQILENSMGDYAIEIEKLKQSVGVLQEQISYKTGQYEGRVKVVDDLNKALTEERKKRQNAEDMYTTCKNELTLLKAKCAVLEREKEVLREQTQVLQRRLSAAKVMDTASFISRLVEYTSPLMRDR